MRGTGYRNPLILGKYLQLHHLYIQVKNALSTCCWGEGVTIPAQPPLELRWGGDNSCTASTGKWKMGGQWALYLLYAPLFPNTFWKVKCRSVLEWMLGRGISVWSTIGMVVCQIPQITHKWIFTLYLSSFRYYNKILVLSKCKGFWLIKS